MQVPAPVCVKHDATTQTLSTLVNGCVLAKELLLSVVGNEVADTVSGQFLDDTTANTLIAIEIRRQLMPTTGV